MLGHEVTTTQHWRSYFDLEVWQTVAVPSGAQYHALYGPLLIIETLGNIVLLGLNILLIFLLFGKRRLFPKAFIVLVLSNALFLWLDEILGGMIPSVAESADNSTIREAVRSTLWAMIWTSYMLSSRRVKATFREVEKPPAPPPIPILPTEPPQFGSAR
jgi:hypothetical protein